MVFQVITCLSLLLLCLNGFNCQPSDLLSGIEVIKEATNQVLEQDFSPLYGKDNKKVYDIFQDGACPLLKQHLEIKSYNNSTNSTAIEAADVVLDYIFNDTCNWMNSLKQFEECTYGNVVGLRVLCAEVVINKIAVNIKDRLRGIEDGTQPNGISWFNQKFNSTAKSKIIQLLNLNVTY